MQSYVCANKLISKCAISPYLKLIRDSEKVINGRIKMPERVQTHLLPLLKSLLWTHHHLNKQTNKQVIQPVRLHLLHSGSILFSTHLLTPVCLSGRLNVTEKRISSSVTCSSLSELSAPLGNLTYFHYYN